MIRHLISRREKERSERTYCLKLLLENNQKKKMLNNEIIIRKKEKD